MAKPTIQLGFTGTAVKEAQKNFIERGYQVGPPAADGIFGLHTHRSVLNYQYDRSAGEFAAYSWPLVVDGIVGPQTSGQAVPGHDQEGVEGCGSEAGTDHSQELRVPAVGSGPN